MFLYEWKEKKLKGMCNDFDIPEELLRDSKILLACYSDECYAGNAFVLYENNRKLFEVNGSHCSCHGLEGQWKPEETTFEALKKQLEADAFKYRDFKQEITQVVNELGTYVK